MEARRETDTVMLIITVENNASEITFRLDGRLAGGGVRELTRSWPAAVLKQPQQQVSFGLAGLTPVDVVGRQFLALVRCRGVSTIQLQGEFRAPVDSGLMRQVQDELRSGARRVQLDLSGVTSLDAAGIGELINAFNATTAAGARLNVVHARPRVRRMLTAVGVLELLEGSTAPR
jgi:anti-anti-sigma factor